MVQSAPALNLRVKVHKTIRTFNWFWRKCIINCQISNVQLTCSKYEKQEENAIIESPVCFIYENMIHFQFQYNIVTHAVSVLPMHFCVFLLIKQLIQGKYYEVN